MLSKLATKCAATFVAGALLLYLLSYAVTLGQQADTEDVLLCFAIEGFLLYSLILIGWLVWDAEITFLIDKGVTWYKKRR